MQYDKQLCGECGWFGHEPDILVADNPFSSIEKISGCPKCKTAESMFKVCCHDMCWQKATCGRPHPDGYRHTCGEHYRYEGKDKQSSSS